MLEQPKVFIQVSNLYWCLVIHRTVREEYKKCSTQNTCVSDTFVREELLSSVLVNFILNNSKHICLFYGLWVSN